MNTLTELQDRIGLFEAGHISREGFENWFLDSLWDVEVSSDRTTQAGFHKIEGLLAEASHAHWSEATIRNELANAALAFADWPVSRWKSLVPPSSPAEPESQTNAKNVDFEYVDPHLAFVPTTSAGFAGLSFQRMKMEFWQPGFRQTESTNSACQSVPH